MATRCAALVERSAQKSARRGRRISPYILVHGSRHDPAAFGSDDVCHTRHVAVHHPHAEARRQVPQPHLRSGMNRQLSCVRQAAVQSGKFLLQLRAWLSCEPDASRPSPMSASVTTAARWP